MTTLFLAYWDAVLLRLQGDPELVALVKYIGEVPEAPEGYPLIWLEDGGTSDWSTKSDNGISATVTLHLGSRYNGTKEIRRIKNKVHELLHFVQLQTATDQVVLGHFVSDSTFFDPDGKTRHCVMNFTYLVCEE